MENKFKKYADLIRRISEEKEDDERASKCGYDIMMGLTSDIETYNDEARAKAWEDWLEQDPDEPCDDEERDGVWVPAIPM